MGQRWSDPEWLDLGARLRARRTDLHLTREALAVTAQLRTSRLAAQERGATCVSAVELRRLAQALKAPINAFLGEARWTASEPQQIVYEALARSDEGAALAEAFGRIRTPRLRRHIVQLATELADQDRSSSEA